MLFLPPVIGLAFANAQADLAHLAEERDALLRILRPLEERQFITLEVLPRADSAAISDFFRRYRRIQIFHFGGHADGYRLLLEEGGNREGLKGLFALQDQLSLVFLNGCDTEDQAELYLEAGVRAVLATRTAIPDRDATAFASAFYRALADPHNPHSILEAYQKAAADLALHRDYRAASADDVILYRGLKRAVPAGPAAELPWRIYVQEESRHRLDWRLSRQTVLMEKLRQGSDRYFRQLLAGRFRYVRLEETLRELQPEMTGTLAGAHQPLFDTQVISSRGEMPLEESILELRRQAPPHCVLKGEGGSGKTVAVLRLWQLLLREAAIDRPAPVFVALHEYNRQADRSDFIERYITDHYLSADLTPEERQAFWDNLRQPLQTGPFTPSVLLLLDGFNEITVAPSRRDLLQVEIERFSQMGGVQIVLTSRYDMRTFSFAGHFHAVDLQPLSEAAVDRYLEVHGLAGAVPPGVRQQVLTNPLMLTLFAASSGIMAEFQGKQGLPFSFTPHMTTYGEIVWNYLQAQLARFYQEEKNLDTLLAAQLLLEHAAPLLGYALEKNGRFAMAPFETDRLIRQFFSRYEEEDFRLAFPLFHQQRSRLHAELDGFSPERILFYLLERLRVLVAEYDEAVDPAFRELSPPAEYRFLHQHFRDFFATLHLRNDAQATLAWNARRPVAAVRAPETLRERMLPLSLRRNLGELAGEHRNVARLIDGHWDTGHFTRSFLGKILDQLRGLSGEATLGFALSNILQTWVDLRGEIVGERLDALDLRRFVFNGVRLSRGSSGRDAATSFADALLHPAAFFHQSHPGRICCATYVHEDYLVISGYRDGVLLLQDTRNRQQRWKVKHHECKLIALAVSDDRRRGFSVSEDGRLCEWETTDGCLLRVIDLDVTPSPASSGRRLIVDSTYFRLDFHANAVMELFFELGRSRACGVCNDGTLRLFSIADGSCLGMVEPDNATRWLGAIVPHPDGRHFFIGYDREVLLWNPENRTIYGEDRQEHRHYVTRLAVSPDGARLLSGDEEGGLREWDIATGQLIGRLPKHEKGITALAYSPDGKTALSGSKDGIVREWTLDTHQALKSFQAHSELVSALQYDPNGLSAISAGWDDRIREWDLRTGACLQVFEGFNNIVRSVDVTADGRRLAYVSENQEIAVWSLAPLGCEAIIRESYVGVWEIRFFAGDKQLVNCGYYDYLHFWNLDTLSYEHSLRVPEQNFTSMDSHPSDHRLLFSTDTVVWDQDVPSGESRHWQQAEAKFIPVRYAPDGRRAVLISRSKVYVWDLLTHVCTPLANVHSKGIYDLAFDVAGARLLTGDLSGKVVVWNLAEARPVLTFDAGAGVASLTFTPDDQAILASGWYHGDWSLFDAKTGERLKTLPPRADGVTIRVLRTLPNGGILAFSDDGYFHFLSDQLDSPERSVSILPGLYVQGCDLRAVRWEETGQESANWRDLLRLYGALI